MKTNTKTNSKKLVIGFWLATFSSSFAIAQASLDYKSTIDANSYKGQTYFSFMKEVVKPQLDRYAKTGFQIADGDRAVEVLKLVGKKVATGAMRSAHDEATLSKIANALHAQKQAINFYDLPAAIAKVDRSVDRYGLSTYLGLASAGGVAIQLDKSNTFYNVNYGTGAEAQDEMTGRSFAATPLHNADDISDKSYLRDLETYVRGTNKTSDFFRVILQGLTNCDFGDYARLSDLGQSVATDFFAIYTAEQDRHLMSNLESHPWDVSLLEVTLLSSLHAGQDKIAIYFDGQMSEQVPNQERCTTVRENIRDASLIDYWQFSTNPDPKNCGRSGINITKKQFRALGLVISDFERARNPQIVANVERHFKNVKTGKNVFAELSAELINDKAAHSMGRDGDELVEDVIAFLEQVRRDANDITKSAHQRTF